MRRLPGGPAAIDRQGCAGDHVCPCRGKEDHRVSYGLRRGQLSVRRATDHVGQKVLVGEDGLGLGSATAAGAMALPVIPFLCLVWFNVTESAQCGGYCVVSIAAMLGLMRYRRSEYSMEMAHR